MVGIIISLILISLVASVVWWTFRMLWAGVDTLVRFYHARGGTAKARDGRALKQGG